MSTLDQINEQLAIAFEHLAKVCELYVESLRTEVVPQLVAAIRASVFRVAACPRCGNLYGVSMAEPRLPSCCGRELSCSDLVEVPRGRLVYLAHPDQYADQPAIVEAPRV